MTRADSRSGIATVAAGAVVVAALYFAKDFLLPLALAALFGFILNPLVRRLEAARVPRALSVVAIAVALLSSLALIGWLLANEVTSLVASLPDFRANLVEKLRALRGPLRSVADALGWIDRLSHELEPATGQAQAPQVKIVAKSSAVSVLGRFRPPCSVVFATAGIVVVLTVFMLVQSELAEADRQLARAARLPRIAAGARRSGRARQRLSGAAGARLSVPRRRGVALGLWLIGVPGAFVFGFIRRCCARFPTSGRPRPRRCPSRSPSWPFTGFAMTLWTLGFFVCLELFTNNVLDPRVLGRGAGLTPFGVIFAATFWAWLWGPPGLVLAIPLTACLTVVGRYMPQLAFLPALLAQDLGRHARRAPVRAPRRGRRRRSRSAPAPRRPGRRPLALSDSLLLPLLAHGRPASAQPGAARARIGVRCPRRLRELLGELVAGIPAARARCVGARALCHRGAARERARPLRARLARHGARAARLRGPAAHGRAGREARARARWLVLHGCRRREVAAVLGSARGAARVRGRDVLVLAVGGREAVPTWAGRRAGRELVRGARGRVRARADRRSEQPGEVLELVEPRAATR